MKSIKSFNLHNYHFRRRRRRRFLPPSPPPCTLLRKEKKIGMCFSPIVLFLI